MINFAQIEHEKWIQVLLSWGQAVFSNVNVIIILICGSGLGGAFGARFLGSCNNLS